MGHMRNLQKPRTDPRLIRVALTHFDEHGIESACRALGIHHQNLYRWRKYRDMYGPLWPTDVDVAEWIRDRPARVKQAKKKAAYSKARYLNRGRGVNPIVSALGPARRIQGLVAIGWSMDKIGAKVGLSHARISQIAIMKHPTMFEATALRVEAVYRELCMTPLTGVWADVSRKRAKDRGWVPPLAWDDGTIDNPNVHPIGVTRDSRAKHGLDEVAIQRRMAGDRDVHVHGEESAEVVRRLFAAGHSLTWIYRHTGLSGNRYIHVTAEGAARASARKGEAA